MLPEIETSDPTINVLLWACGILIAANVAQWAWMIAVYRQNRKERIETFEKIGGLLEHNTSVLQDMVIMLKSAPVPGRKRT